MAFHDVHQLDELHAETQIRFIATILFHSILPSHTHKRLLELDTTDYLKQMFRHALEHIQDILLLHEAHLTVDLRELRLAIRTQILVTETFYDLEITVETGNHQQLLQGLWRLRQSVELSRVHTGRNHEVTGTLRGRIYKNRSLYLQETLLIQIAANLERHSMTKFQILTNASTTQVQITIFHTQVITAICLLLDRERRGKRSVQDI